jgi:hypothetical protein
MEAESGIEPLYAALQAVYKSAITTTYMTCHPICQLYLASAKSSDHHCCTSFGIIQFCPLPTAESATQSRLTIRSTIHRGQCLKTPEEFAEAMKGRETFSIKRSPEGPFTVKAAKKQVPINIWWPEIANAEDADRASKMGSAAAIYIAVVTAIIATVSLVANTPILGVSASGYVDATIFAFVAWGIRCRSNFVSAVGLIIFVLAKGYQFSTQPKSLAGLAVTIFLLCGFISGIRGTRAY